MQKNSTFCKNLSLLNSFEKHFWNTQLGYFESMRISLIRIMIKLQIFIQDLTNNYSSKSIPQINNSLKVSSNLELGLRFLKKNYSLKIKMQHTQSKFLMKQLSNSKTKSFGISRKKLDFQMNQSKNTRRFLNRTYFRTIITIKNKSQHRTMT